MQVCTCVYTQDLVWWDEALPAYRSPLGRRMHLGPHTCTNTHKLCTSLMSYFMSVGIWVQTWDTTTRQGGAGFSLRCDIIAHREICCLCVCVWEGSSVPVHLCLFPCPHSSHVSTHKSHMGGHWEPQQLWNMLFKWCVTVCVCVTALICVHALTLSSLLVRINGTDVPLRGAYRESLTSLHLLQHKMSDSLFLCVIRTGQEH